MRCKMATQQQEYDTKLTAQQTEYETKLEARLQQQQQQTQQQLTQQQKSFMEYMEQQKQAMAAQKATTDALQKKLAAQEANNTENMKRMFATTTNSTLSPNIDQHRVKIPPQLLMVKSAAKRKQLPAQRAQQYWSSWTRMKAY